MLEKTKLVNLTTVAFCFVSFYFCLLLEGSDADATARSSLQIATGHLSSRQRAGKRVDIEFEAQLVKWSATIGLE